MEVLPLFSRAAQQIIIQITLTCQARELFIANPDSGGKVNDHPVVEPAFSPKVLLS